MMVCHCNVISDREIRDIVLAFLRADPWALVVPAKVYHEMGKRGRCCGCFPNVVDIIVATTEAFHAQIPPNDAQLIDVRSRLKAMQEKRIGGPREGRSAGHRAA